MKKMNAKLVISILASTLIVLLAFLNRHWLMEALVLLPQAKPWWLVLAFLMMLSSFFVISQVFQVITRSMGQRLGVLRLWATALVSVVLSQSVPAGGVWSYAFLVSTFKRRGFSTVQATLIATLDILSYAIAMLMVVSFSLIYLAIHNLMTEEGSYVAAFVALMVVVGLAFLLTRSEEQLTRWVLGGKRRVARLLGCEWRDTEVLRLVAEVVHGRQLLLSNPRDILLLAPIQLVALCGHSLAMLVILQSFGVSVGFHVVLTAFGVAMITSVFNVLPGGGGTVETALVAVLIQLGVGVVAVPAAIVFRLLNFWLLVPVAAVCYYWLMHVSPPSEGEGPGKQVKKLHGKTAVQDLLIKSEERF